MKAIEVEAGASPWTTGAKLMRTAFKRPGAVKALPKLSYVLPEVRIEPAHLARYVEICGFAPAHGVPLIYPQLLTFPLMTAFISDVRCPWPAMGTVHLANAIEQSAALGPGDVVHVEAATGRLMAHDKGQVFTMEFLIRRDGQTVWQATQTLLRLGVRDPVGPAYAATLPADGPLARQAELIAAADIGRRYGKLSGDFNPIHLSVLTARAFGFRRAIAHGMWTAARALATLLPSVPVGRGALQVEFKAPVLLPARPSLWSRRGSAQALFEVRDSRGEKPHLRGRVEF